MSRVASSYAFSRAQRLRGPDLFRRVLRTFPRRRSNGIDIHAKSNGERMARLGIVIGRRAVRRAVDRNYCKRQVRETFRRLQGEFIGLDIVVRFQKPWDSRLKNQLNSEILELFVALGRCPN